MDSRPACRTSTGMRPCGASRPNSTVADIPIIVLSAHAIHRAHAQKAFAAGCKEIQGKPVNWNTAGTADLAGAPQESAGGDAGSRSLSAAATPGSRRWRQPTWCRKDKNRKTMTRSTFGGSPRRTGCRPRSPVCCKAARTKPKSREGGLRRPPEDDPRCRGQRP